MERFCTDLGLILDLGGVIVDHDNGKSLRHLCDLLIERPTLDEVGAFISTSGVGNGAITAEDLFARLRVRYGSNASDAQFLDAWTCHFSLKEDVYSLLLSIKSERPIVLCSNTNAAHWNYLNSLYNLDGLANATILSHECKIEKPAPEIYLLAAAAHGRPPRECVFVDDLEVNVAGAKSLGFHTHHFTTFDKFARTINQ